MTSSLPLLTLNGIFYRAVDPAFRDKALCGSRLPGRYSASGQRTLYLGSSPEGVDAAMIAHRGSRSQALELLRVHVTANRIFDLRDPEARRLANVSLDQATAPWQDAVSQGRTPASWAVRNRLESLGAQGLVDPSRKVPGLWHLVLFAWNRDDAAQATILE